LLWHLKAVAILKSLGWLSMQHDSCIFFHKNSSDQLDGLCSLHVDDILATAATGIIPALKTGLEKEFGPLTEDHDKFAHFGTMVERRPDKSVECSQHHYVNMLTEVDMTPKHKKDDELPGNSVTAYRGTVSAVSWVGVTSPLACALASMHQACLPKPCYRDAERLNAAVQQLKREYLPLVFRHISKPWRLTVISDSSFANVTRHSQGGFMVLLGHGGASVSGLTNLVEFKSNKAKRVCTSTMHAEAVSAMTAQEHAGFVQTYVYELEHPGATAVEMIKLDGPALTPIIGITDCEDLHCALISAAMPNLSNKALSLYISALRELRQQKRVLEYMWCDTRDMVANGLTKIELDGTAPTLEMQEFLRTFVLQFKHPFKWGHTMTEE
jgi:hypothetical protein